LSFKAIGLNDLRERVGVGVHRRGCNGNGENNRGASWGDLGAGRGDLRVKSREKSQKIAKNRHRFLSYYADSKGSYGQKSRFKVYKITLPAHFAPRGGGEDAARGGLSEMAKVPHIGQG
jgi:hypothetical protein